MNLFSYILLLIVGLCLGKVNYHNDDSNDAHRNRNRAMSSQDSGGYGGYYDQKYQTRYIGGIRGFRPVLPSPWSHEDGQHSIRRYNRYRPGYPLRRKNGYRSRNSDEVGSKSYHSSRSGYNSGNGYYSRRGRYPIPADQSPYSIRHPFHLRRRGQRMSNYKGEHHSGIVHGYHSRGRGTNSRTGGGYFPTPTITRKSSDEQANQGFRHRHVIRPSI